MDGGTAFEIGYAYSAGKFIIGWSADDRDYIERVQEYFGGKLEQSNCWQDPQGLEVEHFGQPDNLMMSSAVIDVVSDFETAIKLLKSVVTETAKERVRWD